MEKINTTRKHTGFTYDASDFSSAAYNLESSIIRDILKYSSQPGVISFAGGLPAPELFPVEELKAAAERVLTQYGTRALQYGLSRGYGPLREFLAERAAQRGGEGDAGRNCIWSGGANSDEPQVSGRAARRDTSRKEAEPHS